MERAYRSREKPVREIVARCRRLYPHYRSFTGAALEGLRQNVRYLVAGFYRRNLMEGRSPTLKELEPTLKTAQLRAVQGVPLGAMIGCYQLALPILWEQLIAGVDTSAAVRLELLRRVPVTFSSMARVMTVVTEAYVQERDRLLRSRGQAVDEFLRALLAEDTPLAVVEARARALGLRIDLLRVALLFSPAARKAGRPESDDDVLQSLLAGRVQEGDAVVGRVQRGVLALLPEPDHEVVLAEISDKLPKRGWRAGVGGSGEDLAGLRRSAGEAQRALDIAAVLRHAGPVHRYAELALHDLVDIGSSRAEEFARRVLGPLASPGARKTDRETLRALCLQGFRVKLAAGALGIHPHTMSYRLSQIRRRFGIDLENPDTRLRVHLALLILDA